MLLNGCGGYQPVIRSAVNPVPPKGGSGVPATPPIATHEKDIAKLLEALINAVGTGRTG